MAMSALLASQQWHPATDVLKGCVRCTSTWTTILRPTMATSNVDLGSCLDEVRKFASLQQSLIKLLELGDVNEATFRSLLPKEVTLEKVTWQVVAHGVGVRFTSRMTGEVVDAHVGFLESPGAFDAWRLSTYFRSLRKKPDEQSEWEKLLKTLQESGGIHPDDARSHLYVVSKSG